jgi:hypothetical protein
MGVVICTYSFMGIVDNVLVQQRVLNANIIFKLPRLNLKKT